MLGVVSAWKLHPGWKHHLRHCANTVVLKSLRHYWLEKLTISNCQDKKRVSSSSLVVTPIDKLSSTKRGRNEEWELTVKTLADKQWRRKVRGIQTGQKISGG